MSWIPDVAGRGSAPALAAQRAYTGKKEDGTFNEVGAVNTLDKENQHTRARKQETALALAPEYVAGLEEDPHPSALFLTITLEAPTSCGVTGGWLACFGKKNVLLSMLL